MKACLHILVSEYCCVCVCVCVCNLGHEPLSLSLEIVSRLALIFPFFFKIQGKTKARIKLLSCAMAIEHTPGQNCCRWPGLGSPGPGAWTRLQVL